MDSWGFRFVNALSIALFCVSGVAWAGATCYPAGPPRVITDWNDANNWAESADGVPGTCAATGGRSTAFRGQTVTLAPLVPGANNSRDNVIIPSGYEVHVNVPVHLGDPSSPSGTAMTIQGTSLTSYGAVVVDDRALLFLRGYSNARFNNNGGVADLKRFGIFQIMPGGALYTDGALDGQGEFTVGGRFYSGCGNPATAASPFCTASAAGWVQAVVGNPGSFVSSALPALQVGDLVELTKIPQPVVTGSGTYGPPYTTIGKIPPTPAAPVPNMPLTNLGALTDGTPMCVVSVTPLRLGHTTNPSILSCAGATAVQITNAGVGQLWLKKPAFLWGNPSSYTWNRSNVLNISVQPFVFGGTDALRTWIALPGGPYSNSDHTAPGRPGDTSFQPTSMTVLTLHGYSCSSIAIRKPRFEDVTDCGDYYLDEDSGQFCVRGGFAFQVNLTADTYTMFPGNAGRNVTFQTPAGGPWAGNELLIENTNIRYLFGRSIPVFSASNYSSAVPGAHFRFEGNTVKYAGGMIHTNSLTGTAADPIPIRDNAFLESPDFLQYQVATNLGSSWVDVSNNYMSNRLANITTANQTRIEDNPHWSITNNVGNIHALFAAVTVAVNKANTFSDLLFQRNRVMYLGYPITGYYNGVWQGPGGLKNHPARFEWNYSYGMGRCAFIDRETITNHNLCAWAIHHGYVVNSNNAQTTQQGGNHVPGIVFEYNLNVEKQVAGGSGGFFELGYNFASWVDAPIVRNNTSTGNSQGGIGLGDVGDGGTVGLISNATIVDNLMVSDVAKVGATYTTGWGFAKSLADGPSNLNQVSLMHTGNNIIAGPGPAYSSATPAVAPNMTNKSFNRFTKVTHNGGTLYNSNPNRNVTGVMIQNPTYSTLTGASLQFNYNSASDMTVAWNDGTGLGTPAQLNWAGAGVTFPIVGATSQYAYAKLNMTGAWGGGDYQVGCPQANWLKIVSGPGVGKTYAILRCSTDQLVVVPDATADGVTAGSVAVILTTETRAHNLASTQYVDIGIDPPTLPASNRTDSGISLSLTDYCRSGCASYIDPQIVGDEINTPRSFIWEVTQSPVFPIALPLVPNGPSMEYAWTSATYRPAAGAATASTTGGCVGAVSCDGIYGEPQTITFSAPANSVWGASPTLLSATASSGLPVTLSSGSPSVCAVSGNSAIIVSVGTCIIAANQASGSGFRPAPQVLQSYTIAKATPVLTWATPAAITFGAALSASQLKATAPLPGTITYSPAAGTVPAVGTQFLTATFTPADQTKYNAATKTVNLTVNPGASTTPSLILTKTITRDSSRNLVLTLTIANNGGAAQNVTLKAATIVGVSGTPLPRSLGTIGAGASAQTTVTFPASTGATGNFGTVVFSGSFTGGSFSNTSRVVLP